MKSTIIEVDNKRSLNLGMILGLIICAFSLIDFFSSFFGINMTPFLGSMSRYSPIIEGLLGNFIISVSRK
jgi:hypothetical protein